MDSFAYEFGRNFIKNAGFTDTLKGYAGQIPGIAKSVYERAPGTVTGAGGGLLIGLLLKLLGTKGSPILGSTALGAGLGGGYDLFKSHPSTSRAALQWAKNPATRRRTEQALAFKDRLTG